MKLSPLKKLVVGALALSFCLFAEVSHATRASITNQYDLSMGGIYAGALGATATYNAQRNYFIDAGVSMETSGDQNIATWGDILFRQGQLFSAMGYGVNWYWGGGVKFRTENNPNVEELYYVGPRGVAGLQTHLSSMPLEIFSELATTMYVTQATKSEFDFVLGARYYF